MIKLGMMLLLSVLLQASDITTDKDTGLMWQDSSQIVKKDWKGAKSYCANLSLGGYEDWRLPHIDELKSIVDKNRYKPAIKTYFKYTKIGSYLSVTLYKHKSFQVWTVEFFTGSDSYSGKFSSEWVRCVR